MSFLGAIFIFLCGGICSLVVAVFLIFQLITTAEKKVEEDKAKLLADLIRKRSEFERSNSQTHVKEGTDSSSASHLNDKKGWAKKRSNAVDSTKNNHSDGKDVYLLLKANMLFQFVDEKAEKCEGISCLDGFKLSTSPEKANGNPSFKQGSCIVLSKNENNNDSLYFGFEHVKDVEEWYLAFAKAANLTSKDVSNLFVI